MQRNEIEMLVVSMIFLRRTLFTYYCTQIEITEKKPINRYYYEKKEFRKKRYESHDFSRNIC